MSLGRNWACSFRRSIPHSICLLSSSYCTENARLCESLMTAAHGILYASHISPAALSSPPSPMPTHPLTRFATAVLTSHPARMIIVVKTGWQSRTTVAQASVGAPPPQSEKPVFQNPKSTRKDAETAPPVIKPEALGVGTQGRGERGDRDHIHTSKTEASGHAPKNVPDDPLAIERVFVEERQCAGDEGVWERRRARMKGCQRGRGDIRAPDGQAEEEEELGERRVEERQRDMGEPGAAGDGHVNVNATTPDQGSSRGRGQKGRQVAGRRGRR